MLPKLVPRPANVWPQVPPGFKVELYASGLQRAATDSQGAQWRHIPSPKVWPVRSKIFRGNHQCRQGGTTAVFAGDLKRPFGITFLSAWPRSAMGVRGQHEVGGALPV